MQVARDIGRTRSMHLTRRILLAAPAILAAAPAWPTEPLDILAYDLRPLSAPPTADGRHGIVLDVVAAAVRRIGREPRFTFVIFPEAVERARTVPGTLVAPLGRVPSREDAFTWVARVLDVPQAMGTLAGRPAVDLAAARGLARIGVIRGGLQEAFLRENGLTNLVILETGRDLAVALAEGRLDAWYSTAPEIALQFEAIGRQGGATVGPTLQVAPAWLAAHLDARDMPVAGLRAAMDALHADGTVERIYRSYVGG
ncbi:substrate-binding periplasmic protein [Roseomonas sp. CCTCC AB2023176]|uniref:substrate-binding periplasmic protein n=1 Tax=Roseomonas sp. CCTCC AB2023176 TaxID=3342640 RepID=UPI0035D786C3